MSGILNRNLLLAFFTLFSFLLKGQSFNRDSTLNAIRQMSDNAHKADVYYRFIENNWRGGKAYYLAELEECIDISKKYKSDSLTGLCYYLKGTIHRVLNKPKVSEESYLIAMEYGEKLKNYQLVSDCHMALGTLFCVKKDFNRAKPHLDRALSILNKYKINAGYAEVYGQYGVYFGMQDMVDSSLHYQKLALEYIRKYRGLEEYSFNLVNYGITLKKLKKYKEAFEAYDEAAHIADSVDDYMLLCAIQINKAWCYYDQKMYAKAIEHAKNGLKGAREISELDFEIDGLDVLQKSLYGNGNYQEAYETLIRYNNIKDSLFNRDRLAQLNELNTKYEVDLKDASILEHQANIKRQRFIAIGITLGLLIIIVLIWINFRISKRHNLRLLNLNNEIAFQKQELEKLNNVKSVLFTVISHDLRSPLNTLKTFINRMAQGKISPDKIDLYISEISNDVNATSGLIDNLLDWAQSQMQGYKTDIRDINLKEIIQTELEKSHFIIAQKKIQITQDTENIPLVKADKELTSIIFRNILANAIKFTAEGNSIHIVFDKEKNRLLIKDTGIGIEPEMLKTLLTNTLKTTRKGTNDEKGSGMGLMLCNTFAGLMKCNLGVQSEVGKGTELSIQFPATA